MLDNIKSSYYPRIIFSFVDERIKLILIKYNKKLQNQIDISLINYINFSRKYIIKEENGKGKEYNGINNRLIYDGEFLNGKRNGFGKEYDINGCLLYEGEYLNGERNGQGKEYNYFGELIFQGTYLKNKTWKGIIYNGDGAILKELDNSDNNIIKLYERGKLVFEGEYLNGEINGKGNEYSIKGKMIYNGEYMNDKRNGKGKEYDSEGKLIFEGDFYNGKKWNCLTYDKKNNIIYELKNGKGFIKEFNSYGILIFECNYLNGEKNGKGKEYWFLNGNIEFDGEYLNGKRNGKGKEYNNYNKLIFEGEYLYGFKRKGKEYYSNNKLEYEGEYILGKKWSGKGYDENGKII